MTNNIQENFQGSDNSSDNTQQSPFQTFMREFMTDFMRDFPGIIQQMQKSAPDVSKFLPEVSFSSGNDNQNYAGHGGSECEHDGPPNGSPETPSPNPDTQPSPSPETPPAPNPESEPGDDSEGDSERRPYNRKELGARDLLENFEDIDVNGDNRISKKEVRKYVKDEVQNPLDKYSIGRVLDSWDSVKKTAKDGGQGASRKDLERVIENQVDIGVQNRYPA